jgi:hypothetical protein
LSTSPVSTSNNSHQAAPRDDGWQQFAKLVSSINGGNLPAAQKAYANFTQSPAGDLVRTHPQGRMSQAMEKIGEALGSGDVAKAQQALQLIRPRTGEAPPTVASPSISPPDPNAPGAKLNLIV